MQHLNIYYSSLQGLYWPTGLGDGGALGKQHPKVSVSQKVSDIIQNNM